VTPFKRGDFSTCDALRPGRPKTVTTPEIIYQIHELILEDRRISAKSIAGQLAILREWVGSIIYEDLDMWNLSAKWVPKCLKADQKCQRCQSSEQRWNFFGAIQMISCRAQLVTMDETWLYHYNPETKQQSMEWRHRGSCRPKIFRVQKPLESSRLDFLGSRRHPPHRLSSKRQTINAEYCSSVLVQLKDILKEKRRGKITKEVLFLHDNLPAHRALATQKKLAYLGFHCLDHRPYSPDLAPSDYILFHGLEKHLKDRHFSSDAEAIAVAVTWLEGQNSEFF